MDARILYAPGIQCLRNTVKSNMRDENKPEVPNVEEYPEDWWYKVYAAVLVINVLVIYLLWAFSRYFSE